MFGAEYIMRDGFQKPPVPRPDPTYYRPWIIFRVINLFIMVAQTLLAYYLNFISADLWINYDRTNPFSLASLLNHYIPISNGA